MQQGRPERVFELASGDSRGFHTAGAGPVPTGRPLFFLTSLFLLLKADTPVECGVQEGVLRLGLLGRTWHEKRLGIPFGGRRLAVPCATPGALLIDTPPRTVVIELRSFRGSLGPCQALAPAVAAVQIVVERRGLRRDRGHVAPHDAVQVHHGAAGENSIGA